MAWFKKDPITPELSAAKEHHDARMALYVAEQAVEHAIANAESHRRRVAYLEAIMVTGGIEKWSDRRTQVLNGTSPVTLAHDTAPVQSSMGLPLAPDTAPGLDPAESGIPEAARAARTEVGNQRVYGGQAVFHGSMHSTAHRPAQSTNLEQDEAATSSVYRELSHVYHSSTASA